MYLIYLIYIYVNRIGDPLEENFQYVALLSRNIV